MRYLILTYLQKPNGQIDEAMTVTNNIRLKDMQTGSVILDFKKLEVLKATLGDVSVPKEWDKIVAYYYQHYEATIERLFHENGWEVTKTELAEATEPSSDEQDNT